MSAVYLNFREKKLISRKILVWYICISKKRRTPSSLKFIWDRSCCYVLYTIMVVVLVNFNHSSSSCDFLTHLATLRLNSGKFSRHSLAASTFAGDSSLGSANIEMTETKMVSTVCTGSHLSLAFSYPHRSSPGACKIEIHTSPFFSMLGCHMSVITLSFGGMSGYSFGKMSPCTLR